MLIEKHLMVVGDWGSEGAEVRAAREGRALVAFVRLGLGQGERYPELKSIAYATLQSGSIPGLVRYENARDAGEVAAPIQHQRISVEMHVSTQPFYALVDALSVRKLSRVTGDLMPKCSQRLAGPALTYGRGRVPGARLWIDHLFLD